MLSFLPFLALAASLPLTSVGASSAHDLRGAHIKRVAPNHQDAHARRSPSEVNHGHVQQRSSGTAGLAVRDGNEKKRLMKRGPEYSGRATFFAPGLGACGTNSKASDYMVALNAAQYGDMGAISPWCFQTITISYGGKTAQATVLDACPSCPHGGLDMSPALFNHFADESVGVFYMSWTGGSGGGEKTTTTEAEPTTTEAPRTTTTTFDYASASSVSKASADAAWASSSSSKSMADASWASSSSSKAAADASYASSSSLSVASAAAAAARTTTTTTTTTSLTTTTPSQTPSVVSSSLSSSSSTTTRTTTTTSSSSRSHTSSHSSSDSHTTSSKTSASSSASATPTDTVGANLDGVAQLVLAMGNLANAAAAAAQAE